MKPSLGICIVLLSVFPSIVHADNGNLQITCVSRKADQKTTTSNAKGGVSVTKEDWQYVVTFENLTFNDMTNLEVKYLVFYKQEELGSTTGPTVGHQAGTGKIDLIKGHDKAELRTSNVTLEKASLGSGYYYKNGAKNDAEANLVGVWIRVYQNGNLIAEMTRPPNLATKQKWEE